MSKHYLQERAVASTGTLTVAGWSGNEQTVSVAGVTSSNTAIVSPAPSSYQAWSDATIRCTAQGNGTLTFVCSSVPASEITANVVIL